MNNNTSIYTPLSPRCSQGFSLIEVLVALIILSVGMLGVLTLQVRGLQFSQSAMSNTQAVSLASDMADRIRANPLNDPTLYNSAFGAAGAMVAPQCADVVGASVVAACNGPAMAAFDLWHWKTQLAAASGLPSALGAVTVTQNGLPVVTTYRIQIQWNERGEQENYEITIR